MQPKQTGQARELVTGDRFYKANDPKKQVWEVVDHPVRVTKYAKYNIFCKRDDDRHPSPILSDTFVVFLRHKQTKGNETTTGVQTGFREIPAATSGEGVFRKKLV